MIENPFAPTTKSDWTTTCPMGATIEKPDGKLTPERWRRINDLIGRTNGLQHDQILTDFSRMWGLSRHRLKAEIKTYRLHSPPMWQ
jgi:hypothetical protein